MEGKQALGGASEEDTGKENLAEQTAAITGSTDTRFPAGAKEPPEITVLLLPTLCLPHPLNSYC